MSGVACARCCAVGGFGCRRFTSQACLRRVGGRFRLFLRGIPQELCVGGGVYSFAACPRHLNMDHASLSRRSTEVCGGRGVFSAIDFNIIGGEKERGAR